MTYLWQNVVKLVNGFLFQSTAVVLLEVWIDGSLVGLTLIALGNPNSKSYAKSAA
jgi:hypothetical protein